jgi:hypothetical protein
MCSVLNLYNVAKYASFTEDSYGTMWRSMVMFKKELHNGIPNSNVWRVL